MLIGTMNHPGRDVLQEAEWIAKEGFEFIDLTLAVLKTFGFNEYQVSLSTRPEKFVGSVPNWALYAGRNWLA